jgi:archaellum component FlaC
MGSKVKELVVRVDDYLGLCHENNMNEKWYKLFKDCKSELERLEKEIERLEVEKSFISKRLHEEQDKRVKLGEENDELLEYKEMFFQAKKDNEKIWKEYNQPLKQPW